LAASGRQITNRASAYARSRVKRKVRLQAPKTALHPYRPRGIEPFAYLISYGDDLWIDLDRPGR